MGRTLTLLVVLGMTASPAGAALVVPHTVESLDEAADLVVRGRIGQRWSKWDEAHRRIWTHTEVEVLEDLRGSGTAPEVVTLRSLGGTVGTVSMRISGAPELGAGEEFVLFLRAEGDDRYGIVGLSQGAFRLEKGADVVVAVPLLEGLAFVPLRSEQLGQTRVMRMALSELRQALAAEPSSAPSLPEIPSAPATPSTPPVQPPTSPESSTP